MIVERFGTLWDGPPMPIAGRPDDRDLILTTRLVLYVAIRGRLARDGAIELIDVDIDLQGLDPGPDDDQPDGGAREGPLALSTVPGRHRMRPEICGEWPGMQDHKRCWCWGDAYHDRSVRPSAQPTRPAPGPFQGLGGRPDRGLADPRRDPPVLHRACSVGG
jgi:hypothetical protein